MNKKFLYIVAAAVAVYFVWKKFAGNTAANTSTGGGATAPVATTGTAGAVPANGNLAASISSGVGSLFSGLKNIFGGTNSDGSTTSTIGGTNGFTSSTALTSDNTFSGDAYYNQYADNSTFGTDTSGNDASAADYAAGNVGG